MSAPVAGDNHTAVGVEVERRAPPISGVAAGTFDDLTSLGPPQDDIDRQLDQIGAKSAVDDELAQMKAKLGPGAKPETPQIGSGSADAS